MHRARFSSPGSAAFTLIELMVVILLMAILSAVIVPEMRGSFEGALLRASGRKFIDVFHLANGRAVALQQTHRVHLDRTAGRFVLERQTGRSSRSAGFVPVRDLSGGAGTIDHRITFELHPAPETSAAPNPASSRAESPIAHSLNSLTFYPDGTADAAELTLRDQAGFRLALRLNPVTAHVRVTELPRP